jgi:hypothetical protein
MCIYEPQVLSERTIQNFVPTRLAIKKLAGILYFCKSTEENILRYPGSGVVWKDRIKKYGKENIETLWVSDWYFCPHEIQKVALEFSRENQIVESDKWANLKPENGLDGGRNSAESNIKNRNSVKQFYEKNPTAKVAGSVRQRLKWKDQAYRQNQVEKQKAARAEGSKLNLDSSTRLKALWQNPDFKNSHSGKNTYQYDHTIYSFTNGIITIELTQQDFVKKFNLIQSKVSDLVRGKAKTHKGWSLIS